ncbi:MAG: sulfotransferase domain-containing protein [Phycisphaerales bacterium]
MAYEPRMSDYPLFISYPRSGSHWMNCLMELYFDRPRLREERVTLMPADRTDWMWFHDHDLDLDIEHDNVLYLYRDPVDVIYSLLMAEQGKIKKKGIQQLPELAQGMVDHFRRYLGPDGMAKAVIRYELCKVDLASQFKIITGFYGQEFDQSRLDWAADQVSKDKLVKEASLRKKKPDQYMNDKMLSEKYSKNRNQFRIDHGEQILSIAIPTELESYFASIERSQTV